VPENGADTAPEPDSAENSAANAWAPATGSSIHTSLERANPDQRNDSANPDATPHFSPIPDPNPARQLPRSQQIPRLIDPQDQTARRVPPRRWEAIPISWSQPLPASADTDQNTGQVHLQRPRLNQAQPPAARDQQVWDDGGWTPSARGSHRGSR
jgi:hypothetical protein